MEEAIFITALAALLTSIIALATVREMRKQRVVSHMPILKVLGEYATIKIDKNQNWLWKSESLSINNYGKGVALDVNIKWETDIDSIVDILKKYDPYNLKDFSIKNNILSLGNSFHAIDLQAEKNFPALSINNQNSNELIIPPFLTAAFEKYITEAVINRPDKATGFNFQDFPNTNIRVSYKDLNENEYVKTFLLSISLSIVSKGNEDKDGEVALIFDVKEINA